MDWEKKPDETDLTEADAERDSGIEGTEDVCGVEMKNRERW